MTYVHRRPRRNAIMVLLTLQERLRADGDEMGETNFSNPRGFIELSDIERILPYKRKNGCKIILRKNGELKGIDVYDGETTIQDRINKLHTQKELL